MIVANVEVIMVYQEMLRNGFCIQDCIDAGYFDDQYANDHHIKSLLIGSDYDDAILYGVNTINPDIIISMSGCFSPFHQGHLNAMVQARALYESKGMRVMCIFIPANDSYVDVKRNGTCKMTAMERIQYMKKFLEESNERDIVIDEHPALAMPYELNFPYLLNRIEIIAPNVKQSFVVGADNQLFALALKNMGHDTVVLNRDNTDIIIEERLKSHNMDMTAVYIINDNQYSNLSSTLVRSSFSLPTLSKDGIYLIRNDSRLGGFVDNTIILEECINKAFRGINTHIIDAEYQINICKKYIANNYSDYIVISMDKYFKGDFNIECSRLFKPFTYQKNPVGYEIVNKDQLVSFLYTIQPNAKILVVDDDISSGYSFNYIKNIIIENCQPQIIEGFFMNLYYMEVNNITDDVYDIVDARDFISYAKNGGLKSVDGKRYLYKYPYVNIATRAKIPVNEVLSFNAALYGA